MANKIHFAQKVVVSSDRSAWYDHTYWEVPFTGAFDFGKMHSAMRPRVNSTFNTLGELSEIRPGVLRYEVIHSIGD